MLPYRAPALSALGLCLAITLSACQSAPTAECRMGHSTDLALHEQNGDLLTTAILNGVPTTLALDTGAESTVLTRSAADRLKLSLKGLSVRAEGVGGSRGMYGFYADTFQIGTLSGRNLPLGASGMKLSDGPIQVDGLLGVDFLGAYDVDLDLPDHKAGLFRVLAGCSTPRAALQQPLYIADMVAASDPGDFRPRVRVTIDGKTLMAVIDSGAQNTVIFRRAAHRLGLNLDDLAADPHYLSSGIGPRAVTTIRHVVAPITIGEITLSHMPVSIADQARLGNDDMLLGVDFLSVVHVWLSFSSHSVIMQYPAQPSPKRDAAISPASPG